jgi:nucleosome binding factor SPN SPT16 subunit
LPGLQLISVLVAKILSPIRNSSSIVPIEIYAQAKAKDPPTDAVPRFLEAYTGHLRVGTLLKESHIGKLVDEWNNLVSKTDKKPELVDMAPAVASMMASKDEEELVRDFAAMAGITLISLNRKQSGPLPTLHLLS